jgi:5'-nucleotidase
VAFDGDSVIFSEDSQSIYDKHGIKAFERNEKNLAKLPLSGGPFKSFLFELHKLQKKFTPSSCPIKIALVTARSAPSHERVIRTLRDWGIRIDECLFLGGLDKGSFLRVFDADIFFDDQIENCSSASTFVPTAHVISMSQ